MAALLPASIVLTFPGCPGAGLTQHGDVPDWLLSFRTFPGLFAHFSSAWTNTPPCGWPVFIHHPRKAPRLRPRFGRHDESCPTRGRVLCRRSFSAALGEAKVSCWAPRSERGRFLRNPPTGPWGAAPFAAPPEQRAGLPGAPRPRQSLGCQRSDRGRSDTCVVASP